MRPTHRLALLASLALALLAALATVAFATSTPVIDGTNPTTTVTIAGTASGTATGTPTGIYTGTSDSVVITFGTTVPVTIDCSSRLTFTIEQDGTGTITELWFENCTSGINPCVVNDLDTSSNTTTPVTMTGGSTVTVTGGFTVTGSTAGSGGTFVLDGNGGTAEFSFTLMCSALSLDCRFTTPTGDGSGTVPFSGVVGEGTPGTLTFTDATLDTDTTAMCANPDLTGTYTLDDPTEPGADALDDPTEVGAETLTLTP